MSSLRSSPIRSILTLVAVYLVIVQSAAAQAADTLRQAKDQRQSITLVSLVVTSDSSFGIPGAEAVIPGTAHRAKTDLDGFFSLSGLSPGVHSVLIRAIGFRPVEVTVQLLPGTPGYRILETIALEQQSIELEEIVVTGRAIRGLLAGFYRRMETGLGTYFTRDEIEERGPVKTSDVIRGAGGGLVHCDAVSRREASFFDCVIGRRHGSRFCAFDVYLDGAPFLGTRGSIDFIDPRDIEAIEVYKNAATTPLLFTRSILQPEEALDRRGASSTCGVVALWTRTPK